MHMEPTKSLSSLTLNDEKCFVAVFLSKLPVTVMCNVFSAAPEVFSINSTEAIKVYYFQKKNNSLQPNFFSGNHNYNRKFTIHNYN